MDGGGDNQLSVRSFRRHPEIYSYYVNAPVQGLQGPDHAQGDAVALQIALHALIIAELAEDSGFESGSESD
ncbi:uncharacterized protein LOC108112435 [Drosophila eugracilis]|uniref:uncharacterized protein LOC108112435 n=1 Tax=Drosophila eugracilis TaxID=29029 RepID=UPI0007E8AFBB|nr:uncharacterized protein LOC108112435 [Drosophila eugracilis]